MEIEEWLGGLEGVKFDGKREENSDFHFVFPKVDRPVSFSRALSDKNAANSLANKFDKGTTTLGFRCKRGLILACDSRASQGSFIASQSVRKIIEINDFLLGSIAGGAADCCMWQRYLAKLCRIHELRNGERISVAHASKLLANIFYGYRGYGLSCGIMLAGYDVKKQSASLYMIDDSGLRIKGDCFSVGSGSTYAYGVLDAGFKNGELDLEDAHALARKAILHACHRDGASGGVVRVYWVNENGWTCLTDGEDVNNLFARSLRRGDSTSAPRRASSRA